MGTYIPESVKGNTYELDAVDFAVGEYDSHTAIALQTALELGAYHIQLVGYDGYIQMDMKSKEQELFLENEMLFDAISAKSVKLTSLLPTKYSSIPSISIYSLI